MSWFGIGMIVAILAIVVALVAASHPHIGGSAALALTLLAAGAWRLWAELDKPRNKD